MVGGRIAVVWTIEETNALGFTRFFSFDAASNNTRIIDRNGRIREFDYDPLYRMTTERWLLPDPSLPTGYSVLRTISSTYDAASQMTSISDPAYTGTFTYDALGRVLSIDNLGTPNLPHTILTQTWDPAGNRTSLDAAIDGFGSIVNTYGWDALNRMTRVSQAGTGVSEKRVNLAYNGLGQFTQIDRYRDLGGTQLVASSTYGYDSLSRLTSLVHSRLSTLDPQPSTIAAYAWSYDAISRITSMATPDGSGNYAYDPTSQLIAEDYDSFQPDQTHSWDLNGNPVGPGFVVGPNNQLLETPTHEYHYDGEGNRIREIDKATGKARHFDWDHRNRLVEVRDEVAGPDEVVGPGGPGGTAVSAVSAYRYHPLTNYRISKDVRAFDPATADLIDRIFEAYVHDSAEILFATDENEIVTDLYLDGQMLMDMHLANEKFDPAGVSQQTYWSLWDHQWSVRDVVNNAGTPVDHLIYDSFGNVINETAPNLGLRFKYTGREHDRETGLYYYRARYYDAPDRRFLSDDKYTGLQVYFNFASYLRGDPVNHVDPSGLQAKGGQPQSSVPSPVVELLPEHDLKYRSNCGVFSWPIKWKLSSPTTIGGFIVQRIAFDFDNVKKCKDGVCSQEKGDHPLRLLQIDKKMPLYGIEVWTVPPNSARPNKYKDAARNDIDDVFALRLEHDPGCGSVIISGRAWFYEGTGTIPKQFKPDGYDGTGVVPSVPGGDPDNYFKPPTFKKSAGTTHLAQARYDCCTPCVSRETKVKLTPDDDLPYKGT